MNDYVVDIDQDSLTWYTQAEFQKLVRMGSIDLYYKRVVRSNVTIQCQSLGAGGLIGGVSELKDSNLESDS